MTVEAGIETFRAPDSPKWIDELSQKDREDYEIVRKEDVEETVEIVKADILKYLGNSLDEGAVDALAQHLSEKIRRNLDAGIQIGRDTLTPELERLRQFNRNVIGN